MKRELILDADGVLLFFDEGYDEMMSQHFGIDFDGSYIDFCESEYFSKLKPYKGAEIFLKKLHDDGFILRIITACGDSPKIKAMRIKNLLTVFGDIFTSIDFVGMEESKECCLSKFIGRDDVLYVEDTLDRYHLAKSLSIPSVLMRTESTKHIDYDIFDHWDDLHLYIKKYLM